MGRQIETLRALGNDVTVLSFLASDFDKKLAEKYRGDSRYDFVPLSRMGRAIHAVLFPWLPACFAARTSLRFAYRLYRHVKAERIEAIHAEYAAMGQYQWIRRLFPHLKFIMTEHDVTLQSYERKLEGKTGIQRLLLLWQTKRIAACEARYLTKADTVLTFSGKDKRLLETKYSLANVAVMNPYFGIEDVDIQKGHLRALAQGNRQAENRTEEIAFLGQMGRAENAQAAERLIGICRKLRAQGYDIRLSIIGNAPPKRLLEAALAAGDFVDVTGFVEDVDAYLMRAKAAVFPLMEGAGIKLKVLRSLALAIPVVTTDIGAEGIDEAGTVLKLAQTDEEFLQAIRCILDLGEADYARLCQRSCAYVKEHFSWGKSEQVLARLYGE